MNWFKACCSSAGVDENESTRMPTQMSDRRFHMIGPRANMGTIDEFEPVFAEETPRYDESEDRV